MKKIFLLISLFIFLSSTNIFAQDKLLKATIAGKSGGTITVKELLEDGKLKVTNDHSFWVTSYRFSAYTIRREPIEIENESDTLSLKIKEVLPTLSAGTKIYFEYIKAKDAYGTEEHLPPIGFTLQ